MSTPPATRSPCLLLTATIQVRQGMVFTSRRDTSTRLEDYRQAFAVWLNHPEIHTIVLVENSGADLSIFQQLASQAPAKHVECLSFVAPEFDLSRGKGYGEMLCLEHALNHSALLAKSSHVLKVTGRYSLQNASRLLRFLRTHPDLDVLCDLLLNLTWADSRAFVATPHFLRNCLFPLADQLNDTLGVNFEHVLARAVHACMAEGGRWAEPPFPLAINGISGSQDRSWHMSLAARLKLRLRHALFARCLGTGPG